MQLHLTYICKERSRLHITSPRPMGSFRRSTPYFLVSPLYNFQTESPEVKINYPVNLLGKVVCFVGNSRPMPSGDWRVEAVRKKLQSHSLHVTGDHNSWWQLYLQTLSRFKLLILFQILTLYCWSDSSADLVKDLRNRSQRGNPQDPKRKGLVIDRPTQRKFDGRTYVQHCRWI